MSPFLITLGRWGGIVTIILLVITLLKQLIAFVSFLMVAIKAVIVIAFVGLFLLIAITILRERSRRRRREDVD
jgi:O-antigen ligase